MKVYLGLLDETHETWEGPGFQQRIRTLLQSSQRHQESDDPESADVIWILESNRFKTGASRGLFESSPFLQRWAGKVFTMNYAGAPVEFLPGLYVSLPAARHRSDRHVAAPYPWASPNPLAPGFADSGHPPSQLISFRGALSHPIRRELVTVMQSNKQLGSCDVMDRWFNHTEAECRSYLEQILDSKFVLCPRGLATSSYRLYEVLMLGRVPVILSDEWVPPCGPDWKRFSLQLAESRIHELPQLVAANSDRWEAMATAARQAWQLHYGDDVLADTLLDGLERLFWRRTEFADLASLKRFWRSSDFLTNAQWNWRQRFARLFRRSMARFVTQRSK
jgi:hypothetical protein